jgi:hypothetical protein
MRRGAGGAVGCAHQGGFDGVSEALRHTLGGQQQIRTLRDVKNEGRTDYVYENTGNDDKMSCEQSGFFQENAPMER